ncbi:amidohydrolase family protein [Neobacillus ginsengisoli]|uniref:5-methylthioadenosine/S-adenosylhomocysteine deaminase n=1 Tax=Neobacillus ginsengisoli TaxID=904295 RepID=A0ABT9XVX3_9BACI|nr:amidohydrolase [Neobacillus ginsengisoli]MDQ0199712.1 5-methylthioadenosine/S-adenosylhomocysteine deaminase [Neobacillus ginsengisoli]
MIAKKTLIKNPLIVSNVPSVGNKKGTVLVEGQTITDVFYHQENLLKDLESHADEIIDAENMVLIPGMVNSHYHSYTNLLKGTVNNLPLEIWALYTMAYGYALEDEDIYYAVLLGCIEMMKAGVTSCVDHFPHIWTSEAALKAYDQAGMRVAFAPMLHDVPDEQFFQIAFPPSIQKQRPKKTATSIEEMKSFYQSIISIWHQKDGRISIQLGPNAPQRCSEHILQLCKELSEKGNLRIHTHLLETKAQYQQCQKNFPGGLVRHLDRLGLLNEKISCVHAVWLDDEEIQLLVDRNVSIVHNPASNLLLGSGIAPIPSFWKKGANVALGTDGSNCGTIHNLFEAMRLTAMIHRPQESNYSNWMTPEAVFNMATTSGAKVLGMERELGRIASGQKADFVLLKTKNTFWAPLNDPMSQLVHQENGSSVDSVLVNGQWTLRQGTTVTIDEEKVFLEVRKRREGLLEKWQEPLKRAERLRPHFETILLDYHLT